MAPTDVPLLTINESGCNGAPRRQPTARIRTSNQYLAMRARVLVTRLCASDATSRASSTTRPALIRPLSFVEATATQMRRRDCTTSPAAHPEASNPWDLPAHPPLASPRRPWSSGGRCSSLMNGAQKHKLSLISTIGASKRNGAAPRIRQATQARKRRQNRASRPVARRWPEGG